MLLLIWSLKLQGKLRLAILIAQRKGLSHKTDLLALIDERLDVVVDALGAGDMGALPLLTDLQCRQIGFVTGPIFITPLEADLGGSEGYDNAVELGVVETVLDDDEVFACQFVLPRDFELEGKDQQQGQKQYSHIN